MTGDRPHQLGPAGAEGRETVCLVMVPQDEWREIRTSGAKVQIDVAALTVGATEDASLRGHRQPIEAETWEAVSPGTFFLATEEVNRAAVVATGRSWGSSQTALTRG